MARAILVAVLPAVVAQAAAVAVDRVVVQIQLNHLMIFTVPKSLMLKYCLILSLITVFRDRSIQIMKIYVILAHPLAQASIIIQVIRLPGLIRILSALLFRIVKPTQIQLFGKTVHVQLQQVLKLNTLH